MSTEITVNIPNLDKIAESSQLIAEKVNDGLLLFCDISRELENISASIETKVVSDENDDLDPLSHLSNLVHLESLEDLEKKLNIEEITEYLENLAYLEDLQTLPDIINSIDKLNENAEEITSALGDIRDTNVDIANELRNLNTTIHSVFSKLVKSDSKREIVRAKMK